MAFFKRNSARHRAETGSHVVRNTTIAAAAGAAVLGSIAPAQASASAGNSASSSYQAPAAATAAYTAPSTWWSWSSSGGYTQYSYQAPASTYQAPVPQSASVSTLAPQSISSSGKGAGIAAAAMGQVGVSQDCTSAVSNALAAVGIDFRGWPAGYLSLGTQVSAAQAQPGDLVYYADGGMGFAHIGVYIGDGNAVHGGWNGNQTVVDSVNVGSGPVYIRVN